MTLCCLSNERFIFLSYGTGSNPALKFQSSFFPFLCCWHWGEIHSSHAEWALGCQGVDPAGQDCPSCSVEQHRSLTDCSPAWLGKHCSLLAWQAILLHVLGQVQMLPCLYPACTLGNVSGYSLVQKYPGLGLCGWTKSLSYPILEILIMNVVNLGKPGLQLQVAIDSTS